MNNYNASLQEKLDNMNMSQGAATFLLKTLSGNKYEIVDYNGTQCIVWNDGIRMGGMQPLNVFMKSLEMTGSENTPEAYIAMMKTDIAAFKNSESAMNFQKDNKTAYAVFDAFENAEPNQVNNCVEQSSKFSRQTGNMEVESTLRKVIQVSMLDRERATEAVARDIRDNWNSIVK